MGKADKQIALLMKEIADRQEQLSEVMATRAVLEKKLADRRRNAEAATGVQARSNWQLGKAALDAKNAREAAGDRTEPGVTLPGAVPEDTRDANAEALQAKAREAKAARNQAFLRKSFAQDDRESADRKVARTENQLNALDVQGASTAQDLEELEKELKQLTRVKLYDGPFLREDYPEIDSFDRGHVIFAIDIPKKLQELTGDSKESGLLQEIYDEVQKVFHDGAKQWEDQLTALHEEYVRERDAGRDSDWLSGIEDSFWMACDDSKRSLAALKVEATDAVAAVLDRRKSSWKTMIKYRVSAAFKVAKGVFSLGSAVARGAGAAGADPTAYIQAIKALAGIGKQIKSLLDGIDKSWEQLDEHFQSLKGAVDSGSYGELAVKSMAELAGIPFVSGTLGEVKNGMKKHTAKIGGYETKRDNLVGKMNEAIDKGTALERDPTNPGVKSKVVEARLEVSEAVDAAFEVGAKLQEHKNKSAAVESFVADYESGRGRADSWLTKANELGVKPADVAKEAKKITERLNTAKSIASEVASLVSALA